MLDENERPPVRRLLDATSRELTVMKKAWIDEFLTVGEDFERASARVRAEKYEPARRDDLLKRERAEHLERLRQVLEKQSRQASDYCLALQRRMRAVVASGTHARPAYRSEEAKLLSRLLDLTTRRYAADVLARDDPREIARCWRDAESSDDTAIMDAISSHEAETLPEGVASYRSKREARGRIKSANELVHWVQRERTVVRAVYDSAAEAISRA